MSASLLTNRSIAYCGDTLRVSFTLSEPCTVAASLLNRAATVSGVFPNLFADLTLTAADRNSALVYRIVATDVAGLNGSLSGSVNIPLGERCAIRANSFVSSDFADCTPKVKTQTSLVHSVRCSQRT